MLAETHTPPVFSIVLWAMIYKLLVRLILSTIVVLSTLVLPGSVVPDTHLPDVLKPQKAKAQTTNCTNWWSSAPSVSGASYSGSAGEFLGWEFTVTQNVWATGIEFNGANSYWGAGTLAIYVYNSGTGHWTSTSAYTNSITQNAWTQYGFNSGSNILLTPGGDYFIGYQSSSVRVTTTSTPVSDSRISAAKPAKASGISTSGIISSISFPGDSDTITIAPILCDPDPTPTPTPTNRSEEHTS